MAGNILLDAAFKRIISDMRPHASKLARNTNERRQVTLWIKKLLGLKSQKRERNEYAQLLLSMLDSGRVTAPFLTPPPSGSLQALTNTSLLSRDGDENPNELEDLLQLSPEGSEEFDFGLPGSILSTPTTPNRSKTNQFPYSPHGQAPAGQSYLYSSHSLNPLSYGAAQRSRSCASDWDSVGQKDMLANVSHLETEFDSQFSSSLLTGFPRQVTHRRHSNLNIPLSSASDDITTTDHTPLRHASPLSLSDELKGLGLSNKEGAEPSAIGETLQSKSANTTMGSEKGVRFASNSTPALSKQLTATRKPLDVSREMLQEEKVRLQQQSHEVSLRKILDRKNSEIESLRAEGVARGRQLEAKCRRLEARLQQQEQLLEQQREETEAEREDSHKLLKQRLKEEFDLQLHKAIAGFESEKLEVERRHSRTFARLQEEASASLKRARQEHTLQSTASAQVISEQQCRLGELEAERETLAAAHSALAQAKVAAERQCAFLQDALARANDRMNELDVELGSEQGERERQLTQLKDQMEQAIHSIQLQHSGDRDKLGSVQQQLEETTKKHQMKLSELHRSHSCDRKQLEALHKQEVSTLTIELKQQGQLSHETQQRLEQQLRKSEQQVVQLRSSQELKSQQAEHAIEEFKSQVEAQTSKMFERMQRQLKQLEGELALTRSQRGQEAREHGRAVQQLKHSHQKELAELQSAKERDAAQLKKQHQREVNSLKRNAGKDKDMAVGKVRQSLEQQAEELKKTRSALELKVKQLGQQLRQQTERHTTELALARDTAAKEKEQSLRIQESTISKLRCQLENQRSQLREENKKEVKALTEKHASRTHQLEHSMAMKTAQSTELLSSLQAQVQYLQEDMERQGHSHAAQLAELLQRHEQETASLKHQQNSLQQDLLCDNEAANATVLQLEKRVEQAIIEGNSKLSHVKLQYESRMKDMIPLALKEEYEDTIKSLKAQVGLLTQRASILQEEVDRHYSHTFSTSQSHTPTPSHPHHLPATHC